MGRVLPRSYPGPNYSDLPSRLDVEANEEKLENLDDDQIDEKLENHLPLECCTEAAAGGHLATCPGPPARLSAITVFPY